MNKKSNPDVSGEHLKEEISLLPDNNDIIIKGMPYL